jgi:MFS family permease
MSNLLKFKIAKYLSSINFFLPVVLIYMQSRGFSVDKALLLVTIHSVNIIVLEYPTGIIGDYFSHRISVILGYFLTGIALFLLSTQATFSIYVIYISIYSLGLSLISGSDVALLHSLSKKFTKDISHINAISLLIAVISIVLGSFIAKFSLALTVRLTATSFILASIFLTFIKENKKAQIKSEQSANIFHLAKKGLLFILHTKNLYFPLLVSSGMGAFYLSLKWIYNPYFESFNIPTIFWGSFIGIGVILTAISTKLYPKFRKISLTKAFSVLIIATFLSGFVFLPVIPLFFFLIIHFMQGFINTKIDIVLNQEIKDDSLRAGTLSFRSLASRLGQAVYIFLAGSIISQGSIFMLFSLTSIFFALLFLPKLFIKTRS